jgi:hypothetical protein
VEPVGVTMTAMAVAIVLERVSSAPMEAKRTAVASVVGSPGKSAAGCMVPAATVSVAAASAAAGVGRLPNAGKHEKRQCNATKQH